LPVDPEIVARDGPLLILGALLSGGSPSMMIPTDDDMSFMVKTTLKYLTDGVRAGEAKPDVQKKFAAMIPFGIYSQWIQDPDPDVSRTVRDIVASLPQDLAAQIRGDGMKNRFRHGLPVFPGCVIDDRDVLQAFDGSGPLPLQPPGSQSTPKDAIPIPGSEPRDAQTDTSVGTVVEAPALPTTSCLDNGT
jgi:hypothetical protein